MDCLDRSRACPDESRIRRRVRARLPEVATPRLVPDLDRGDRTTLILRSRGPERSPGAVAHGDRPDEPGVIRGIAGRILVALRVARRPGRRPGCHGEDVDP